MRTSYGGPRPVRAHHPGGRKGGPDDGPSQRARPRTQGEEALGGGRRSPEGGESPSLGRAEGILAPEPPERGGRGEGPAREGAPGVTPWGHGLPSRSNAANSDQGREYDGGTDHHEEAGESFLPVWHPAHGGPSTELRFQPSAKSILVGPKIIGYPCRSGC